MTSLPLIWTKERPCFNRPPLQPQHAPCWPCYITRFGVGGEYGEGVLLVEGKPEAYYATAGASFGLQLGAQTKSEVIVFTTAEALASFRASNGWQAGVDGSIAMPASGAGGSLDTRSLEEPVVGFIFSNQGLMGNLTFEGAKITRIAR